MEKIVQQIIGGNVVGVENISRYLQTQGVIVRVSVGGGRNSYYVSPKVYGVVEEKLSEESNEFIGQHVKDGRISLLPKEDEKRIRGIESRVKKKLRETAIGYGDSFVPMASFGEYKEYFEKNQREFFELRDELVERYDAMKSRFATIARSALREMNAVEGERELEQILSRLPSRDTFAASFRMDMNVSAFPTTENVDMFDESVRDAILNGAKKNEDDLLVESVVSTINEGVATLSSVIRSLAENGKLHSRVTMGVKNGVNRMAQKNIAGNEKLNDMRASIAEMLNQDPDEAANTGEYLLTQLYAYSKELGLDDKLDLEKCPFTVAELEDMVAIYC